MNTKVDIASWVCVAVAASLLSGCSHMPYEESEACYQVGDYKGASVVFRDKEGQPPASDSDGVLPNLYMGAADFMGGALPEAIADFERVEQGMQDQAEFGFLKRMSAEYMGRGYDAAMANAYKAVSYLAQGSTDDARVEFNRAEEVSKRIFEKNKKAIDEKSMSAEIISDDAATPKPQSNDSLGLPSAGDLLGSANDNEDNRAMLEEYRHSLDELCGAGSYENAAIFFLDGVLDLFWGIDADDAEGAVFTLKKAYGLSASKAALAGAMMAEGVASGKIPREELSDLVCVVFENGLGPRKESNLRKFIIPWMGRDPESGAMHMNLIPVGLDLPKLVQRSQAYQRLVLGDGVDILGSTLPLCDFDRIVATEFRAEMPRIIAWQTTKCVLQATVSIIALEIARRKGGQLGEVAAQLALLALSNVNLFPANIKNWNYLPKEFQARFARKPKSGRLALDVPGLPTSLAEIDIPADGPVLVYVKIPYPGAAPLVVVSNGRSIPSMIQVDDSVTENIVQ